MDNVVIILAAGLGTRMKSTLPKVMHPLAGIPMLNHLLTACEPIFSRIVVVTGPDMPEVASAAAPHTVIVQHDRGGTADAAKAAQATFGSGAVTIIYGDNPLLTSGSLVELTERLGAEGVRMSLLGTRPTNPGTFGRVLGDSGFATRIVEYADASDDERQTSLCNAGGFTASSTDLWRWLQQVDSNNSKNEFYLTDIVKIAYAEGARIAVVEAPWDECRGVNSRAELAVAEAVIQTRLRNAALAAGVTMTAPETVFLTTDTQIAQDVTIEPHVVIGRGVTIASGAVIRAFSHIEGCTIGEDAVIGPYARVRPGSVIDKAAHVGNFVELKATHLGAGAKANHLSYLGDATIGSRTNIGAGTITCNYDGHAKHRTTIGSDVFVGSDVALVAPVTIGNGALIAAGSVVTHHVEADALAIGRARQIDKPGRAARYKILKDKA
jgi:bifunctional UDP-N-acetylglucosamine pyrophosphorylase/glucosamine-1-phosphate N-acetyltransferase